MTDDDRFEDVDRLIDKAKKEADEIEHPYNGDDVERYDDIDNEDDDPSKAQKTDAGRS